MKNVLISESGIWETEDALFVAMLAQVQSLRRIADAQWRSRYSHPIPQVVTGSPMTKVKICGLMESQHVKTAVEAEQM